MASSATSWFTSEIQQMMFGFGDSRRPLQETAVLVEEIVHQQMVAMIHKAWNVASQRGDKDNHISIEDILFLLRKDPFKLRRLLRYYEVRDLKNAVKASIASTEDSKKGDLTVLLSPQDRQIDKKGMSKNRQVCYDFLSSIDQTGELIALFDDRETDLIKHERMLRAELQSQGCDHNQYIEFCKARQVNFSQRHAKSSRFKDWLVANLNPEIVLNPSAVELFSYLAYETVAQVVDLALLVKQDQRTRPGNPMARVQPAVSVNYTDLHSSSVFSKRGGVSPLTSSICVSPTSEPSLLATSSSTHLAQSASKTGNKKKRKKSDPPSTVEISWDSTILPSDVREALRRYYTDISPFASDMKINPHCSIWEKTLCS